jgi:integrase
MASAGRKAGNHQARPSITWTPEPGMSTRQIEKELERIRIDFERRVESSQFISSSTTFAEYSELWIARGKEGGERPLAPKTIERYTDLLKRINAAIGHIKLEALQPHHLRDFLNNLREPGIVEKTAYKPSLALPDAIKKYGKSLRSLARIAGLSCSTVSIANKGGNVSHAAAMQICMALCKNMNELFVPVGEQAKLSERTILHHYRLISSILTAAVVDDGIIVSNPAKRVRPPSCKHLEAEYLDEKQATHLMDLLEPEPLEYQTAVKLILFSGARRGEVMGLKWQDVDFDNATLSICRASQYTPSKGIFEKAPKTQASIRTIKLPTYAIVTLREYKKAQAAQRIALGELWKDEDWIFTAWNGTPLNPDTFSGWFKRFIKKTDLPDISIHSLRHTNAALLIAGGENVRTVSRRLGHSQTSTTLNIYSHAIESADARAAQTLENLLSPMSSKKKIEPM